jgi:flagellar capping protein FliD
MTDPISGTSSFSVRTIADGKPVVSTVRDGIDPLDIAEKLKQATIEARQPTQDKIDSSAKQITELGNLRAVVSAFQKVNSQLMNKNSYFKTNILQNLKPVMTPIGAMPGSAYLEVSPKYSKALFDRTYDIQVTQIAKRDNITAAKTFADSTTVQVGVDDSLVINGTTITILATDTLGDIVTKINNEKSITNVEASSVMLSTGNFSLKLSAQNLAEPIDLTGTGVNHISPTGLGFSSLSPVAQETLQAKITVDGTQYIRDTNTNITDVIPGVSFNALAVMSEPTLLDFTLDREAIAAKTNEWVLALNDVKKFLAPHLIAAKAEEPQAEQDKHILYGNRILMQTVDMIHQITQGATGIIVSNLSTEFQRFGFDQPEDNPFGGEVKFDAQKLGTLIQDKTLDFVKLMGNYAEVSNADVEVLRFPSNLSAAIAGVDIDLQFVHTEELDVNGNALFDVTLRVGTKTETVRSALNKIVFENDFAEIVLIHKGTPPIVTQNMTVKLTQGISARMEHSLGRYLANHKEFKGTLARTLNKIMTEKEGFKKQIDDTKKRADEVYARTVRAMQAASKRAEQAAQISKMLKALQVAAMKGT